MKKIIKFIVYSFFLINFFIIPATVSAQEQPPNQLVNRLTNVAKLGGYQTDQTKASSPIIIGTIIGAFLGFMGIAFIVIMIIAGFAWMRAQGNEEEIKKAKASIREALIGLVVAMSAYSIWNFIFKNIIAK